MNNQVESKQKENQKNEPLNDLPVAEAELDMVKGGDATPLPVLLVLADQRDFYYR